MMLSQVAVVVVSFPATPLLLARARICLSASHTKEELLKALEVNSNIAFSSFLAVILVISVLILFDSYFLRVYSCKCILFQYRLRLLVHFSFIYPMK